MTARVCLENRAIQGFSRNLVMSLKRKLHIYRNSAGCHDDWSVGDPRRVENHNLFRFTGRNESADRFIYSIFSSRSQDDIFFGCVNAVFFAQFSGNALAQSRKAEGCIVVGMASGDSGDSGNTGSIGRIEVWFSCSQGNDVNSSAFNLLAFFH